MRVLVACEFSGIVRDAFIERGHDAISCDLLPTERPGPHIQGDVLPLLREPWDLVIAHPPCTYLSVAGQVWFKSRPERFAQMEEGARFFDYCLHANAPMVAVENPRPCTQAKHLLGEPTQYVQPFHFGHSLRKLTGLWLRGLPPLMADYAGIEGRPATVVSSGRPGVTRSHTVDRDGQGRSQRRSRTFPGIAAAMAQQWGG